jgi:hypothetical protein
LFISLSIFDLYSLRGMGLITHSAPLGFVPGPQKGATFMGAGVVTTGEEVTGGRVTTGEEVTGGRVGGDVTGGSVGPKVSFVTVL